MGTMLGILFELLIFAGFGLLYYYFQKRRIIRQDQIEIMQIIDEVIAEAGEDHNAKEYLRKLQEASYSRNYPELLSLTQNPDHNLSHEIKDVLRDLDVRIKFYVK